MRYIPIQQIEKQKIKQKYKHVIMSHLARNKVITDLLYHFRMTSSYCRIIV